MGSRGEPDIREEAVGESGSWGEPSESVGRTAGRRGPGFRGFLGNLFKALSPCSRARGPCADQPEAASLAHTPRLRRRGGFPGRLQRAELPASPPGELVHLLALIARTLGMISVPLSAPSQALSAQPQSATPVDFRDSLPSTAALCFQPSSPNDSGCGRCEIPQGQGPRG